MLGDTTGTAAQQQALAQAEEAVAAGDMRSARGLLEEAFGPEVLALPDARPPVITQSLLRVRSGPEGRQISLQLVDGIAEGSGQEVMREVAGALLRVAPVSAAGNALTVTLAYADPAELIAAQDRLAAALPRLPELALLSSALTTRRLAWPEQAGLLSRTTRYEERVDLSRSVAAWEAEAQKLESAADLADATAISEVNDTGERLNWVRAEVWRSDARAWRDLAALSRAIYTVELREQGAGPEWLQARVHQFYREGSVDREWVIRAGETRQLETAIVGWRYDRVALAAGAAVLLAALAAVVLWLVTR